MHRGFRFAGYNICHMQENLKVYRNAADTSLMNSLVGVLLPASLPSAVNSGLTALAAGNRELNQAAQQIANLDSQNVVGPLLDLSQSSLLAEIGAAVIKTSDRMLGSLLNVFA